MCNVLVRVEAGGLDRWPEPALRWALADIERSRARVDADQAVVLAELVRRGRPRRSPRCATPPLFDATLLTENLRNHGFDATCVKTGFDATFAETYDATRTLGNGRILVPRAQFDEAHKATASY